MRTCRGLASAPPLAVGLLAAIVRSGAPAEVRACQVASGGSLAYRWPLINLVLQADATRGVMIYLGTRYPVGRSKAGATCPQCR